MISPERRAERDQQFDAVCAAVFPGVRTLSTELPPSSMSFDGWRRVSPARGDDRLVAVHWYTTAHARRLVYVSHVFTAGGYCGTEVHMYNAETRRFSKVRGSAFVAGSTFVGFVPYKSTWDDNGTRDPDAWYGSTNSRVPSLVARLLRERDASTSNAAARETTEVY